MRPRRDDYLRYLLEKPDGRVELRRTFLKRLAKGESFKAICEDLWLPWNLTCAELGFHSSHIEEAYWPPKVEQHETI